MDGSRIEGSGSRAHAVRLQHLMAKIRQQDDVPSTHETRPRGPSPAERSAKHMGVGDNLTAALSDVHTQDNPTAPTFADELKQDMVVGDGTLEPGTAFASVSLSINGQLNAPMPDPVSVAKQTSAWLASAGQAATLSHSAPQGNGIFGLL